MNKEIEQALNKISLIALKGLQDRCPGCDRKQGYIFYANEVRDILTKLVYDEIEKQIAFEAEVALTQQKMK